MNLPRKANFGLGIGGKWRKREEEEIGGRKFDEK
jgi:hypothetical protein